MNSFTSKFAKASPVTNESFNTRLLDNLTTAVVVLDKGCCLYHMNPAAEALLETSNRHSHQAHVRELLRNGEVLEQAVAAVRKTNTAMISRRVELLLPGGNKLLVDHATSAVQDQGNLFFLLELQEINRSWSLSRKETLLAKHEITVEMIRDRKSTRLNSSHT